MNKNENNFEALRQLLALKRHEVPPPGYFNDFSAQIINRIRAGEANAPASMSERLLAEAPWVLKFLKIFEAKPAFAGAFASALLVLLVGITYAERPEAAPQPFLQPIVQQNNGSAPQFAATSPTILSPMAGQTGIIASTNPVLNLQPVASLFGQQNSFAQPVTFRRPAIDLIFHF